jgi:hypothetical protein
MKTSELIKQLQALQKEHGDLELMEFSFNGSVTPLKREPSVRYLRKLRGKEFKRRHFESYHDPDLKDESTKHIYL